MPDRGFIGPIGDDLPSLVPIVFALVIFFTSFNAALSAFDSKNTDFSDDLEALKIARILRSNGYIIDKPNFDQLCHLVEAKSLRFVAGIAEFNVSPSDSLDPSKKYDFTFFESPDQLKPIDQLFYSPTGSGDNAFYCTNLKDIKAFDAGIFLYKKAVVRSYPIIIEKERPNGLGIIAAPMQLVVVAWRQ